MSARARPASFTRASSRMVWIDSSRARSIKAQVLTTRQSAVSATSVISWPDRASMPSISSESTWFLGQPRVVKWTFMTGAYDPTGSPATSNTAPGTFLDLARLSGYLVAYAASPPCVLGAAADAGHPGHRWSRRGSHRLTGAVRRGPPDGGGPRDHPGPERRPRAARAALVSICRIGRRAGACRGGPVAAPA